MSQTDYAKKRIEEIKYQWSWLKDKKNLSRADQQTLSIVKEQAKK